MGQNMLVVVDYQNDFVDGSLGFSGAEKMDSEIANLVESYIASGDMVVVTMDTHMPDYLQTREGKNLPVSHCIKGESGWELYGKTKDAVQKHLSAIHLIEKTSFGVSPADMLKLQEISNPERIEFVGLVSNICVLSNVCCFQSAFTEAAISVRKTATASFDSTLNEKTMDVLKGIQVSIIE